MTTIVATVHPTKGMFIGCDSLASTMTIKTKIMRPKWSIWGDRAIGVSGYLRSVNLVEEHIQDLLDEDLTPFEITCALREMFREDGFSWAKKDESGGPPVIGHDIVLVADRTVFEIDESFALSEVPSGGFGVGGSGYSSARGALHALSMVKITDPERMVHTAIKAASEVDLMSGGPAWIARYKNERDGWVDTWYE